MHPESPWSQFVDRADAGRQLAARLASFRDVAPVVVGLARGGVPVAAEIARALGAPLDVLIVRKIGAPGHPEFAIGAMTAGLQRLDEDTIHRFAIPRSAIDEVVRAEARELARREALYRRGRAPIALGGRTVLLVDDGLATGQSARVALDAVRALGPRAVVFAAPVCAPGAAERVGIDEKGLVCAMTPPDFYAVGAFYQDFAPTADDEVIAHLEAADRRMAVARG